jgi:hypothetical protein
LDLERPINQLNLMLALAREWPVDDEIRPLFREWGYSVRAVGRKFALPISVYAALKDSVPMKIAAGPDLILVSETKGELLELECKTQSFGMKAVVMGAADTDELRQARTLLLLDPASLAGSLGLHKVKSGSLVYVIATESVPLQEITLEELSSELRDHGQAPVKHWVWGLKNKEDGVYLWNVNLGEEEIRVVATTDPDWEPIRTIPFDPSIDAKDEKGVLIFSELVRQSVAVRVLEIGVGQGVLDPVAVCRAVIPIWDFWDPECTKPVLARAKEYIDSILAQVSKMGLRSMREKGRYLIEIPSDRVHASLTRYFASPRYWRGDIDVHMPQDGPPMFEEPTAP